MTLFTFSAGCLVGLAFGVVLMRILFALSEPVTLVDDLDEDPELTAVRHQLAVCQDTARQQQQRADYYYDLYCEGAKANAVLRRTHVN